MTAAISELPSTQIPTTELTGLQIAATEIDDCFNADPATRQTFYTLLDIVARHVTTEQIDMPPV